MFLERGCWGSVVDIGTLLKRRYWYGVFFFFFFFWNGVTYLEEHRGSLEAVLILVCSLAGKRGFFTGGGTGPFVSWSTTTSVSLCVPQRPTDLHSHFGVSQARICDTFKRLEN